MAGRAGADRKLGRGAGLDRTVLMYADDLLVAVTPLQPSESRACVLRHCLAPVHVELFSVSELHLKRLTCLRPTERRTKTAILALSRLLPDPVA